MIGLDRSPAMLAELRRRHAAIPVVVGDAGCLPVRSGAVDVGLLVTTLEFVERPEAALAEAIRVARRGLVLVVLNRWSLGGLSRRIGPQSRRPILGSAQDMTLFTLRRAVRAAAGERLRSLRWASSLFPDGLWAARWPVPWGRHRDGGRPVVTGERAPAVAPTAVTCEAGTSFGPRFRLTARAEKAPVLETRERREGHAAVIVVTRDDRMLAGFDRAYRMTDGRISVGEPLHGPVDAEPLVRSGH